MAQLIMTEEGSTPSTPGANKWKLYFKSDGVYIIDDLGAATGPFEVRSTLKTYFDTLYTVINTTVPYDGWIPSTATWSYSSADSPTFVISVNADMTAKLQAGMRIKLTQTTAKYFIVTAVGAFSAGATLVTVYGGTDYTLANAAITSPYYSSAKSPFGFNTDPAKWTITVISDSSNQSQATPTASTWYNVGSLSGAIHIGAWRISVKCRADANHAGVANLGIRTTLSTANNSESNTESTTNAAISATGTTNTLLANFVSHRFLLNLASKTTHYLNVLTGTSSCSSINLRGDLSQTIVKAECAYL